MSYITIPSKNIYKIENPKVVNNSITKIETEANKVKPNKDFNALAYSQTNQTSDLFDGIKFNEDYVPTDISNYFGKDDISFKSFSYYSIFYYAYAVVAGQKEFTKTLVFKIPKTDGNKYIEKLFSGNDRNGNSYIQKSVTYRHQEAFLDFSARKIGDDSGEQSYGRYELYSLSALGSNDDWETQTGSLPSSAISVSYSPSDTAPKLEVSFPHYILETDLADISFSFNESDQTYYCYANVLCGFMNFSGVVTNEGQANSYPNVLSSTNFGTDSNGNEYGSLKIYEPLSVQFSFYGDVIKLDISKEKITIGSEGQGKTFSAESSELLQQPVSPYLFEPIITQYENGKETAKITCSISDYFSDDGNIAIDTKGKIMSFDIGDLVVPMIFGVDGKDRPMSKYMDGTPKVFRVAGTKFVYDGAVWQELTLQEQAQGV